MLIRFNHLLNVQFDSYRRSVDQEGPYIAQEDPRLINIRYVDDIDFYATSFEELVSMIKKLINALQRI